MSGFHPGEQPRLPMTPQPPPATQPSPTQPVTSGKAISGLVLAIVSCIPIFLIFPIAAIASAIIAVLYSRSADKQIQSSGGSIKGTGLVTATRIIAGVSLAVWAFLAFGMPLLLNA